MSRRVTPARRKSYSEFWPTELGETNPNDPSLFANYKKTRNTGDMATLDDFTATVDLTQAEMKDDAPGIYSSAGSFRKRRFRSNMSKWKDPSDMKASELRAELNRKEAVIKKMSRKRKRALYNARNLYFKGEIPQRGSTGSLNAYGPTWAEANQDQRALRRGLSYYGQGDYWSKLKKIGKWGARVGGAAYGAYQGFEVGGAGGALRGAVGGWNMGKAASQYVGLGDYAPVTNQIIGGDYNPNSTISVNKSDLSGDVYIENSEFIGNIVATVGASGSSPFELACYQINPGLQEAFPFLSQIAQNYVLYDMQGLIFQYKPTSGSSSNSTNIALGKVIMSTEYDPDASDFINSVQMENNAYTSSGPPCEGILHGVETHPMSSHIDLMYVRTGTTSKDLTQTDVGRFCIATEGISGTPGDMVMVGELWVTYRCRLSRPSLYGSVLGQNILMDCHTWDANELTYFNAGTLVTKSTNSIGTSIESNVATPNFSFDILFPRTVDYGAYMISCDIDLSDANLTNWPNFTNAQVNAASTAQLIQGWIPQSVLPTTLGVGTRILTSSGVAAGTAKTSSGLIFYVNIDAPGDQQARITVHFGNTPTTAGPMLSLPIRVRIQQVNRVVSLSL